MLLLLTFFDNGTEVGKKLCIGTDKASRHEDVLAVHEVLVEEPLAISDFGIGFAFHVRRQFHVGRNKVHETDVLLKSCPGSCHTLKRLLKFPPVTPLLCFASDQTRLKTSSLINHMIIK